MNYTDREQILYSGDLELIAASLPEEEIFEHFGADSFEYLAYEHMLADQMQQRRIRIPRRSENPAVTRDMLRGWLREFHKMNGLELPTGFHKKKVRQLRGMYYGMLDQYHLTVADVVSRYQQLY